MTDMGGLVRSANPAPPGQTLLADDQLDALLVLINERNATIRVQPVKQGRRGWLVAAAAAVVVLVVLAPVLLFAGDTEPDVGGTGSGVATTVSPTTALEVPAQTAVTWSQVPHDEAVFGGDGFQGMSSVTVGGPGLVAVGRSKGDAMVWISLDGIDWLRIPHDEAVFGGASMESVTVGGPGLVAVGSHGSRWAQTDIMDAAVWTSPDGITWTRVPHNEAIFGGPDELDEDIAVMLSVTQGGPGLVAVGFAGTDAAVWTSPNGVTWSRVPHDDAVFGGEMDQGMYSVTVGGPGLVAVGHDGVPHGTTRPLWMPRSGPHPTGLPGPVSHTTMRFSADDQMLTRMTPP